MAAAANEPSELEQQFEKLQQAINQHQHSKVIKVADTILKLSAGDADALACKAVAYLQLGEYEEAARVLGHKQLQQRMQFERAYCCYRLNKFEEALKLLSTVSEEQMSGALQLAAQVHFRLDRGQECLQDYQKLQAAGQVASLEQKTNLLAAYVTAGLSSSLPDVINKLGIKPRDSFEIAYNRACGMVVNGDTEAAETAVKAAYKQGEEALFDEEFTEEEVLGELAPLTVLLAFLLIKGNRFDAALDKLHPLVAGELHQREIATLAANNWAVASFATDPQQKGFYSRSIRKLESLLDKNSSNGLDLDPDIGTRLDAEQKQLLHLNRALLYMLSGKLDQARQLSGQLLAAYPNDVNVVMLQAVLLAKSGKASEADQLLASHSPSGSSSRDAVSEQEAARPVLLRAQLALEAGNGTVALQLLGGALPADMRLLPGVLATRVALYEQTGDVAGAEQLLQSALQHYKQQQAAAPRSSDAAAGMGWCLQRLVSLKLAQGDASEAMALYQQLSKLGGAAASTSSAALAQLARAAAAAGDSKAVAVLQQQLPAAYASLGEGLDLDALEDAARAVTSSRRREELTRKREEDQLEDEQPRHKRSKKKKKKPRYPKNYDPSKPNGGLPPPDPERWLPKWERSDAKKKKKMTRRERQQEATMKGSQGAGKVDEALDRGAKADKGDEADAKGGKGAAGTKPQLPARPGGKGKVSGRR